MLRIFINYTLKKILNAFNFFKICIQSVSQVKITLWLMALLFLICVRSFLLLINAHRLKSNQA